MPNYGFKTCYIYIYICICCVGINYTYAVLVFIIHLVCDRRVIGQVATYVNMFVYVKM